MAEGQETPWEMAKKRQYQRHEDQLAKGGRKQINSGRLWFSKRDVINYGFLMDGKSPTERSSITFDVKDLKKLTQDAFFHNCLPAMPVQFVKENEDWILIRQVDFEAMQDTIAI